MSQYPKKLANEKISDRAAVCLISRVTDTPWHPNKVGVALSGELGYTSGTTDLTFKDRSGETLTKKGNYLTVWKKDAVGSWKVLFDSFNYE